MLDVTWVGIASYDKPAGFWEHGARRGRVLSMLRITRAGEVMSIAIDGSPAGIDDLNQHQIELAKQQTRDIVRRTLE